MQYEEIIEVDPKDILVGENIRTDPSLDREFVASIKEHGVISPVIAYRIAEGENQGRLELVWGQRRRLGAIEAGRATIPALVARSQAEALEAAKVDRIVKQIVENDQRAGVTDADRAAAYEQLALLGLSPTAIAKKVSTKRDRVQTALAVRANETATQALSEHPLTLDQAAALAEFSDDDEAVARLIEAAHEGGFDHAAQRERDNREEQELIAAKRAELGELGVPVLDQEAAHDPAAADLRSLVDADGNDLTENSHAKCPGHGAVVLPSWGGNVRVVWLCTDWRAHGHRDRHGRVSGPMTDEQKQERRELIATNKAWDSAEQVRRAWLRTFLTRKSAPKDAAQYVARTMLAAHRTVGGAIGDNNQLLAELLGHDKPSSWDDPPMLEAADKATPARAQVLTLGVVLAGIEASLTRQSWRNPTREAADYLTALTGWGYELADVERIITEHETD